MEKAAWKHPPTPPLSFPSHFPSPHLPSQIPTFQIPPFRSTNFKFFSRANSSSSSIMVLCRGEKRDKNTPGCAGSFECPAIGEKNNWERFSRSRLAGVSAHTGSAGTRRRRRPEFFLVLCSGSPRLCFVDLCTLNSSVRELLL